MKMLSVKLIAVCLLLVTLLSCGEKIEIEVNEKSNFKAILAVAEDWEVSKISHVQHNNVLATTLNWNVNYDQKTSHAEFLQMVNDKERTLLYVFAHGFLDENDWGGISFDGEPFVPDDVPDGLNYTMVFINGCFSGDVSSSVPQEFYNKFHTIPQTPCAYIGSQFERGIQMGLASSFALKFLEECETRSIVQALNESRNHFQHQQTDEMKVCFGSGNHSIKH